MTVHTHIVKKRKHREFLKEERRDSLTQETIKPDDRIVFCAKCQCAFLLDSWQAMAKAKSCKNCNHTQTLKTFPKSDQLFMTRKVSFLSSALLSKRNFLFLFFFLLLTGITLNSTGFLERFFPSEPPIIITGAGVKLRKTPQFKAKGVRLLQIGTIVHQLKSDRYAGEDWYRVVTSTNEEGWVPAKYAMYLELHKREQTYLLIAKQKLSGQVDFGILVDLYHFLDRVSNKITQEKIAAELKLLRLLALQRSLEEIPPPQQHETRYSKWIDEQRANIVYNNSTDMWLVKKELFQQLHNKYRSLPIADKILREAEKVSSINNSQHSTVDD